MAHLLSRTLPRTAAAMQTYPIARAMSTPPNPDREIAKKSAEELAKKAERNLLAVFIEWTKGSIKPETSDNCNKSFNDLRKKIDQMQSTLDSMQGPHE